MALLWVEGFEGYGTNVSANIDFRLFNGRYTGANVFNMRPDVGRLSGYSAKPYGATDLVMVTPSLTTDPTLFVGFGWKTPISMSTTRILAFYTGATESVTLNVDTGLSSIFVKRGSTVLGTVSHTFIPGTWYYIECKVVCDPTVGSAIIRLNGLTILTLTGINTQGGASAYHDVLGLYGNSTNSYGNLDDIYLCDSTGTVNNTFLGVCGVVGIFPSADTATAQWTTSTGPSHFSLVNENPSDGDTTYVEGSSTGQEDLYAYDSIATTGSIAGLSINTTCIISSGVSANIQTPIVSSSTTSTGPSVSVPGGFYNTLTRISELDPHTGLHWLPTDLNLANVGLKVV